MCADSLSSKDGSPQNVPSPYFLSYLIDVCSRLCVEENALSVR